jgi:glycosyltransferase involved in cell wall biosynthesis
VAHARRRAAAPGRADLSSSRHWICSQLGAREHYAAPRALHQAGRLRLLITDAWIRPGNPIAHIPIDIARRLAERCHPDLPPDHVHDLTLSLLTQEVEWRLQRRADWDLVTARNEWFMREAAAVVRELPVPANRPMALFAHSYSAREVLREAKARGWLAVLGQIDAGEEHFTIARRLAEQWPQYGPVPAMPPSSYFESWQEECALADRIVVNSDWTRQALRVAGVDAAKVVVVPLPFDADRADPVARSFPDRFTPERPLRLLFVGSVSVIKGAPPLLDAMALLADLPVTVRLVGAPDMVIPDAARRLSAVEFVGAVPRGEIGKYYDSSDVLVFPSHSDGFGLVQIEAQARGLPVIASHHCGRVVEDGVNGILLPEVTADAIASAVRRLLDQPLLLKSQSQHAAGGEGASLQAFGKALIEVAGE